MKFSNEQIKERTELINNVIAISNMPKEQIIFALTACANALEKGLQSK